MEILGVKIDQIDLNGALPAIGRLIEGEGQHLVVTVNPEFIVEAQKNEAFKKVLNSAQLSTCDGAGLVWAAKLLKQEKLTRVTGVDLTEKLLATNFKLYLLGGAEGVAWSVKEKYPQALIVGAESGGKLKKDQWVLENNPAAIERIKQSGAEILLVAFGQVKQEMWIYENLKLMPNIKIAIGIGGTFDYLSGKLKRPPLWLRKLGLEWLYRLVKEPRRAKRIWNATAVFSWLVIKDKLK